MALHLGFIHSSFFCTQMMLFLWRTHELMNRLLELLKAFCDRSGLKVNVAKTKMLICSKGPELSFEFEGRAIENVMDFKYLGIKIPSSYKWSRCVDRWLATSKRMYYMLETICNHKDVNNWKIRCILFEAYNVIPG